MLTVVADEVLQWDGTNVNEVAAFLHRNFGDFALTVSPFDPVGNLMLELKVGKALFFLDKGDWLVVHGYRFYKLPQGMVERR